MPVPWGRPPDYKLPTFPLPTEWHITQDPDRAMTLRQLRELAIFIRRLCKMRLLRFDDDYTAPGRKSGELIRWSQVTEYDISNLVIKRVIPEEGSCSWMELVAQGRKRPVRFMVSHWWGESFRDFTASVEHHAREYCASNNDAYWVCLCADNQWTLDLNDKLADTPFFHAIREAEMLLLMLDRRGTVRTRGWCIMEWNAAVDRDLPIEVGTPLGLVGKGVVSSGPFVELLNGLQSSKAEMARPEDWRRVLNHIAGIDELTGLIQQNGRWVVDQSQPIYEFRVLQRYEHKFKQLDQKVKQATLSKLQQGTRKEARAAPSQHHADFEDAACRGISLLQLRNLAEQIKFQAPTWTAESLESDAAKRFFLERHSTAPSYDVVNIHDVVNFLVVPQTAVRKCSYVEIAEDGPKVAEYYLDYSWSMKFADFMRCVEWIAETRSLPDSTIFWCCFAANNQHDTYNEEGKFKQGLEFTSFGHTIRECVGVCALCSAEVPIMSRVWCVLELAVALNWSKPLDFVCPTGALAVSRPFENGGWEFGFFDPRIASDLLRFQFKDATASVAKDKELIQNILQDNACFGFGSSLDARIHNMAAGPVLRDAACQDDSSLMEAFLAQRGADCRWLLSKGSALGPDGESPLHVAAACGNLPAMELLVTHGSELNAQDSDGETPLHFAAFAAQPKAVSRLLEMNADPMVLSFFSETALQVAQQAPAGFMSSGMAERYKEVEMILGSNMAVGNDESVCTAM